MRAAPAPNLDPDALETQRRWLEAFCRERQIEVVAVYGEVEKGNTLRRPELARALADATMGVFDMLVVLKPDRLSRRRDHLLEIIEQFRAAGVAILFVDLNLVL